MCCCDAWLLQNAADGGWPSSLRIRGAETRLPDLFDGCWAADRLPRLGVWSGCPSFAEHAGLLRCLMECRHAASRWNAASTTTLALWVPQVDIAWTGWRCVVQTEAASLGGCHSVDGTNVFIVIRPSPVPCTIYLTNCRETGGTWQLPHTTPPGLREVWGGIAHGQTGWLQMVETDGRATVGKGRCATGKLGVHSLSNFGKVGAKA